MGTYIMSTLYVLWGGRPHTAPSQSWTRWEEDKAGMTFDKKDNDSYQIRQKHTSL